MSQATQDTQENPFSCCIPPSIRLQINSSTDRRAVTSKRLQPGAVILRNAPLAHVLHNRREQCSTCGIKRESLSRCSRCQQIWYCSRACQAADFPFHKVECREPSLLLTSDAPESTAALLVRTFLRLEISSDPPACSVTGSVVDCSKQHFEALLPSELPLVADDSRDVQRATQALFNQRKRLKRDDDRTSLATRMEAYMRRFRCNNFGVLDDMVRIEAGAVYPLGALLNHSCSPNCVLRYRWDPTIAAKPRGPILEIVAAREIEQGEELTHSYVELVAATVERKARLLELYGFNCECQRCLGNCQVELPVGFRGWDASRCSEWVLKRYAPGGLLAISNEEPMEYVKVDDILQSTVNQRNQDRAMDLRQQAKYRMLQDDNDGELAALTEAEHLLQTGTGMGGIQLYSTRCDRLGSLLANGIMQEALVECREIVAFLCLVLTSVRNHPLIGLQLFTMGDLEEAVSGVNTTSAHATYKWAHAVLTICQGSNSNMVQTLESKLAYPRGD
eukprot:Nitzschia sp. Nitz4//scaffold168_size48592//19265//20779//NITZ4_007048-RA/size48592-processed-gene-0.47-mRNA-1//1//CDS//3329538315//8481//frame0